ncbi:kelch-like protein 32 [Sinocyclocheilus rhinocerous]|uniref:kelch-like protein 32 n=1 Tax=Sinocyclocheilus rhinocerous TaxID=307959 RepID=UPI0007B8266F|nr:PREDICTED: kelch-like protein 32 [Sinocyclocheilus rhinocerous]
MPSEPPPSSQDMLTGQRLCQSKSHQDSVLSALNQQRKDGLLCDVTLVAGEQKFHAHKAVLAACSDYFRAMFSLCMVESEADEVTLQGVTSVGLKNALDFAYTGQIMLEPGVIQDVLSAGSHLQLLELLSLCSHYLIQELNSFNYLDLYRLADLFHLPALEEAVVGFLVDHLSELQRNRQEEVLLLPYRLLREVLKSDRLTSLSEEEICQVWHELNSFNYLDLYRLADLFHLPALEEAVVGFLVDHLSELQRNRQEEVLLLPYRLLRENQWLARSPMLQRRVYHVMAAVKRQLYVLGGNDLDYNNDRILVRHIDSYDIDMDQWTRCTFSLLTGQNEAGVSVHDDRIYVVGGYSIWTNEPLACIQVLDVSTKGKEEVFYGPTLPFASNGVATCFLPAPYFTCPNLQTLQVPHHRIGAL